MRNSEDHGEECVPDAARDLARRLGCLEGSAVDHVLLRQAGKMRQDQASDWMAFKARQRIQTTRCAFEWNARTGPMGVVYVKDAFDGDCGALSVEILGIVPIARLPHAAELDRGELLRYLAELPWAPDAILLNRGLSWRSDGGKYIFVSAGAGPMHAEIRFSLDADGLIREAYAKDRARAIGGRFENYEWRGVFSNYRQCQGRLIPMSAEVGWVMKDRYESVWRGDIIEWGAA